MRFNYVIIFLTVICLSNLVRSENGLQDIVDLTKQVVFGLPVEIVINVLNTICSVLLKADLIQSQVTPDINQMNFQLMTSCANYTFPMAEAEQLWDSPHFDPTKKVVIFTTGWRNTVNKSGPIQTLSKPFLCRKDVNFIVVDAANFADTLYTWSSLNTEEIGKYIAVGLTKLIGKVPIENVHLVGHSLGAHIAGFTGRYFHEMTGQHIHRITGLDPAKPCFREGTERKGLLRSDALFVDILHSNPGVLGDRENMGTIDFYPDGLAPLATNTASVSDSHNRAVIYFGESTYPGNEKSFVGTRCPSLKEVKEDLCTGEEVIMGYGTPTNAEGQYYVKVNGRSPHGQGLDKETSQRNMQCGTCSK